MLTIKLRIKAPNWNDLYKQGHWYKRSKMAKEIHDLVCWEIKNMKLKESWLKDRFNQCQIFIEAHYKNKRRHDISNICEKILEDGLVLAGIIKDDNCNIVTKITKEAYIGQDEDCVIITVKGGVNEKE